MNQCEYNNSNHSNKNRITCQRRERIIIVVDCLLVIQALNGNSLCVRDCVVRLICLFSITSNEKVEARSKINDLKPYSLH